eukprot:1104394-Pleurochrysis_carterae.AAC.1
MDLNSLRVQRCFRSLTRAARSSGRGFSSWATAYTRSPNAGFARHNMYVPPSTSHTVHMLANDVLASQEHRA